MDITVWLGASIFLGLLIAGGLDNGSAPSGEAATSREVQRAEKVSAWGRSRGVRQGRMPIEIFVIGFVLFVALLALYGRVTKRIEERAQKSERDPDKPHYWWWGPS